MSPNPNNRVLKAILSLHEHMLAKQTESSDMGLIKRVDDFMSELSNVGIVEGLEIGGIRGRYFMIDGNSWYRANRKLKGTAVPNFVIWEETDFFSYLDSLLTVLSKSKKNHDHKLKH
jgi:hypothetical protein